MLKPDPKLLREFTKKMSEIDKCRNETSHITADNLLCDLLTKLGYKDVVEVYDTIEKWYA